LSDKLLTNSVAWIVNFYASASKHRWQDAVVSHPCPSGWLLFVCPLTPCAHDAIYY